LKKVQTGVTISPVPPKYISPKQLAQRWSLSPAATYRLLGTVLPTLKIGCSLRIPMIAVEQYEAAQTARALS
jgi:hypothetical protein